MAGLFSSQKPPRIVRQTEPVIKSDTKAVQEAVAEANRKRRTARGFRSTILSNMMNPAGASQAGQTFGS